MKKSKMLSKSNIQEIINSFKEDIPKIFANNIMFAFLCGSLAKGTISKNSDVDMFICLKSKNIAEMRKFLSWYKLIHKRYKLKPDHKFPGEVMNSNVLDKALKNISKSSPQLAVENNKFEDGLIWTGMLSGKNKAFIGNKPQFLKHKRTANNIIKKWHKQFSKNIKLEDPDMFLKQLIQFYKSRDEKRKHFSKIK